MLTMLTKVARSKVNESVHSAQRPDDESQTNRDVKESDSHTQALSRKALTLSVNLALEDPVGYHTQSNDIHGLQLNTTSLNQESKLRTRSQN